MTGRLATSLCCAGVGGLLAALALAADGPSEQQQLAEKFASDVKPLVAQYCVKCHSGDKPKGKLSLDKYQDANTALASRETWAKVAAKLHAAEMPPEGKPRPSPAEFARMTAWLEAAVGKSDCSGPRDPGRVTIRRLNRVEYDNTIRDLVGVDFQPGADFPSDDVGYGFDNIGDVLSLPPLLLEKYLAAAGQVADAAIISHRPEISLLRSRAGRLDRAGSAQVGERERVRIESDGDVSGEIDVPAESEFLLRARAWAEQAGGEPAKMALRIDGKDVHVAEVKATRDASQVYEARTKLSAGKHRFAVAFVNDYYNPDDPDEKNRDRNLIVESLEVVGPGGEYPASHRRIIPRDPTPDTKDALAREIVERFATRAFRRPVMTAEVDRLLKLVAMAQKEGDGFESSIKLAVQAVLVSPNFLFRVELDSPDGDPKAVRTLNDFELATRLSYFLWSTMPDEELFEHARRGTLRSGENLRQQVQRMLMDTKSGALVENFAGQWLQLRNLKTVSPNRRMFRFFNDKLRDDMRRETELFFAAVKDEDRSVLDFLDGRFTFVNERLARLYNISGVTGEDLRRVDLADDRRGGVLAHASVLTVTSNPTRTSPVKRGKWILENILGTPPQPPPPDVPELKEQSESSGATLRERMIQHRSKAECATCHARMDPLGFGLENFNAVGAWRTRDGDAEIDPSGELPGGEKFAGPAELRGVLMQKKGQFVRCLSEKLLTYALGRGLEYYDRCTVDDIVAAVEKGEYKFSSLVLAIVQSDAFQKRRAKGNKP